jgi:hypothetical protein
MGLNSRRMAIQTGAFGADRQDELNGTGCVSVAMMRDEISMNIGGGCRSFAAAMRLKTAAAIQRIGCCSNVTK